MKTEFDIIIVGAGIVGLTAAIAFAQSGTSVALIDRRAQSDMPEDFRASAIAASSLRMLTRLGVELGDKAQPIQDMMAYEGTPESSQDRSQDTPQNPPQSPPWQTDWKIHFGAAEKLGTMVENTHLRGALWTVLDGHENIVVIAPAEISAHRHDADGVSVSLSGHDVPLKAKLLVAADGRNSKLRRAAGITVQSTQYSQRALVTIISHSLPHEGLALQRFMRGGPLAVLPLPGSRSQIVWSDKSGASEALEQLSQADFLDILADRMGDYLGDLTLETPRQSYPLGLQVADNFTAQRLALIGDAAHVIHPLAGQGLNLGLRDVAALAEGIGLAKSRGQDIGVAGLLDYAAWRNLDVRAMGAATHSLNMMFGIKNPIFGHMRRLGLKTVNEISPLKGLLMQNAAGNLGDLPAIMRI